MTSKLRRDDEVKQHRAEQHGERDAQAGDHARADQQHAGLEHQPGHLAARNGIEPLREVERFRDEQHALQLLQPDLRAGRVCRSCSASVP